jgi:hypothetical protein
MWHLPNSIGVELHLRGTYAGGGIRESIGVDVDGLRSMCVSRLHVAVGAGIWRANHKTLGAWAKRAYPVGPAVDNNNNN